MENEIVINGETYVKKEQKTDWWIVRTYSAGVFYGHIKSRVGQEVVMTNARRVFYWAGAASLSQLSIDGTSKPNDCKFPQAVPEVTILQAIEILPMSETAVKSLNGVKIWTA